MQRSTIKKMSRFWFLDDPFYNQYNSHVRLDNENIVTVLKNVELYLGIKAHSVLGCFVEFWVFQHVFFPAGALKYSQSERRQCSEDLEIRIIEL